MKLLHCLIFQSPISYLLIFQDLVCFSEIVNFLYYSRKNSLSKKAIANRLTQFVYDLLMFLNTQCFSKVLFIKYMNTFLQYDKWTDEQRRRVLEDLLNKSKIKQLKYVQDIVNEKVPCIREDFTRELPKILSIYIFSFLDPRSLSRCARVSINF